MAGLRTHGWFSTSYLKRIPILVCYRSTDVATVADFVIDVPKDFDLFWANVLASGFDMVLTMADGVTELIAGAPYFTAGGWDRLSSTGAAFNKTTRVGGVRVAGLNAGAGSTLPPIVGQAADTVETFTLIYLYFHSPNEVSDHTHGIYAAVASMPATLELWDRKRARPRVQTSAELPGAAAPRESLSKTTLETRDVFWDFERELHARKSTFNGKRLGDAIRFFQIQSYDSAGAAAAVEVTNEGAAIDHAMVRTRASGGTDATNYVLSVVATTVSGRVLDRRAKLSVNDPAV
jgi:hypothetical protein